MTDEDTGVARILRRATDDLRPDVARLVAVGVARGRAQRRRRQLGAALASAAVVVIIGAGAVAVPVLSGDGDPAGTQVATDPSRSTPSAPSTTSPTPDAERLTVPATDIPGVVAELAPGHDVGAALTGAPYPLVDKEDEKVAHFRVDGMLTTIVITRASQSLAYDCTDEAAVECHTLDDGTIVQVPPPSSSDGVTMRDALAIGETWMVNVMSYNAPHGKETEPVQSEPALTRDELVAIAASNAWFD